MKFKPARADRLSPEEREIVDRFERGVIDAAEAGRLLLASVDSVRHVAVASLEFSGAGVAATEAHADAAPEAGKARALVERLAPQAYGDRPDSGSAGR